jgi:hypothetical protein
VSRNGKQQTELAARLIYAGGFLLQRRLTNALAK